MYFNNKLLVYTTMQVIQKINISLYHHAYNTNDKILTYTTIHVIPMIHY